MQWQDEAIIIGVRSHGETAAIVELWTRSHGRHLGLVHGGRSRRLRPILQIGNHVDATWKARLSDLLGHVTLELRRGYAAETMNDPAALAALSTLAAELRWMPERDAHPNLYEITLFVIGFLDDISVWPALLVRWELALLEELGFGLELNRCASTGANDQLIYVSPKSGRAVSASAGEPYAKQMLALPGFLGERRNSAPAPGDVIDGFALTGFFLSSRVLMPRDMQLPDVRERMIGYLKRDAAKLGGNPITSRRL